MKIHKQLRIITKVYTNREIVSDKPLKLESPGRVTLGVCLTYIRSQQSLVPNVLTFQMEEYLQKNVSLLQT
jgi:hypothetical protein